MGQQAPRGNGSSHLSTPLQIAGEIYRKATRPDVTVQDLVATLERAPNVARAVFATARRPLYTQRRRFMNLSDAGYHLGPKRLLHLVLESAVQLTVFSRRRDCAELQLEYHRAIATAHMADLVATHCGGSREHAFLTGLLHRIGPAWYVKRALDTGRPMPLIAMDTGSTGEVLRSVTLPPPVRRAVQPPGPTSSPPDALFHILSVARHLSGVTTDHFDYINSMTALSLSPKTTAELVDHARDFREVALRAAQGGD